MGLPVYARCLNIRDVEECVLAGRFFNLVRGGLTASPAGSKNCASLATYSKFDPVKGLLRLAN